MAQSILTKEQLRNYNMKMLNLGAPVKYDYQGYNKLHYSPMMKLAEVQYLSDKQAAWIARVLRYYTKTQLTEIRDIIAPTIEFYANRAEQRAKEKVENTSAKKKIQVLSNNDELICINWNFDARVNNSLKEKLEKDQYSWKRNNNGWLLNIKTSYLEDATAIFSNIGLDVTELIKIINQR